MSDDGLGYMMARAFEMADRMQDAFCDDAPKMKNAPGQHPQGKRWQGRCPTCA